MSAYLFLGGSQHRQVINMLDERTHLVIPKRVHDDPETPNETYRKERVRFDSLSAVFVFVPQDASTEEASHLVGEFLFGLWTEHVSREAHRSD